MSTKTIPTETRSLIKFIVTEFKEFNPSNNTQNSLSCKAGNYVVLLKKETPFPTDVISHIPVIKELEYNDEKYLLIYTGVANDIQERIEGNHLGDNAGHSTLRLSLGCLKGYIKINRDRKKKHKKFKKADEEKLTKWMKNNLIFLYHENPEYVNDEEKMISSLNPPLNITNNKCEENKKFRKDLRDIRSKKTQYEDIIE